MASDDDHVIRAGQLTKCYGRSFAVKGIDLSVRRGEIFGFLGPNGAGKTTAIRCMLDLIRPAGGTLRVLGHDPQKHPVAVRARCGYLPGELRLDENVRVRSALEFFRRLRGLGKGCQRRIYDLADRLGLDLNSRIKNLSKGNKQKVGIVAAFMHSPELLLLDEPTSGLDPLVQKTVLELVREARDGGATVFFSSHVLAEVQSVAERVAIIRAGEIVEIGSPKELTSSTRTTVYVAFGKGAGFEPEAIAPIPDLTIIERDPAGERVAFSVGAGGMDALVKWLGNYHVESLETARPSLEDVFLAHYGDTAIAAGEEGE